MPKRNQKNILFLLIVIAILGVAVFVLLPVPSSPVLDTSTSLDKTSPNNIPENQPTQVAANNGIKPVTDTEQFQLYTRVTDTTWPQLQPFAKEGDLYWGHVVKGIPANMAAYTFPDYAALKTRASDKALSEYAAINLDGEYKDYALAYSEAQQIRAFVDAYNLRHTTDRTTPLQFVAFYHLTIIDAYPQIVTYPDVVLFGKAVWNASNIVQNSQKYVSLIQQAHKTPGVVLGDSKIDFTISEITANFHSVFDKSPTGLGVTIVGFYYPQDKDDSLLGTLQTLRRD